ncbi:MAG: hypothetical protein AAFW69_03575 [Pseudomonadota bacterium]
MGLWLAPTQPSSIRRHIGLLSDISQRAVKVCPSTVRHIDCPISTRSPCLSVQ